MQELGERCEYRASMIVLGFSIRIFKWIGGSGATQLRDILRHIDLLFSSCQMGGRNPDGLQLSFSF